MRWLLACSRAPWPELRATPQLEMIRLLKGVMLGMGSFYSQVFAGSILRLPGVSLVGACPLGQRDETLKANAGKTRTEYCEAFEAPLFEDAETMVEATQPDFAFVTAWDRTKADWALWALDHGLDVYVSKPLTNGVASARKLAEAEAAHPERLCGTLDPGRYDGAIAAAKAKVDAGALGKLLSARVYIQHGKAPLGPFEDSVEFGEGAGGTEYTLGVYAADMLGWFIDSTPTRVWCEAANLNSPGYPWPDTMYGTVRYADGRIGGMSIIFSTDCAAPQWEIELVGDKGILRTHQACYEAVLWPSGYGEPTCFYRMQNDVIFGAVASWVDSVATRRKPDLTFGEALDVIKVCAGWQRSGQLGLTLDLIKQEGEL